METKLYTCNCGAVACVGVRKRDDAKYMIDMEPDPRRYLKVCFDCWMRWELEHGYRDWAAAIWLE